MIPRRVRFAAAAVGLAVTAASADAQFFPGFRPGFYYSSPFGSFGMGFSSSFSFNQQWVNPYTGQFNRMNLHFSYAGPAPLGADAQQNAFLNQYYSPHLQGGYLSGGVNSLAAQNPVVNEQLRQFAGARPAANRPAADPRQLIADQMAFERGDAGFARPPVLGDPAVLDPSLVRPAEEQVVSGEVLNRLAAAIRELTAKGAKADSPLFPAEVLARVTFEGSVAADVIQMVRAGTFEFPPAFAGPGLDQARAEVAAPAAAAVEALAAGRRVDGPTADRLATAVKKARADAAPTIRDLPPGQAADVARFLNVLDGLAQIGRDPGQPGVYPAKWVSVGATAAELLAQMGKYKLTFGPAAPGSEDAYHALTRGLIDYYAALSRPKK